ncbi:MAG TPA: extracellular solute-binding protein [Acidimicrobiales bacterium]|nr:extracellular solute-binding protein [Acidimicrobiales bacterium]
MKLSSSKAWPLAAAVILAATACTAGDDDDAGGGVEVLDPDGDHEPVTVSLWVPFTGREFEGLQPVFDGFEDKYPWITLDVTEGVEDDDQVVAAIRAGDPPDAVMSFSLDSVGQFCDSEAWQNLEPYIEASDMDTSVFPEAVTRYTTFGGSTCAFPFLTDAMGLYYNTDKLAAEGVTDPPTTLDDLRAAAERLTVRAPDGSIEVAGFVPWFGYYEFSVLEMSVIWDAAWYDEDGKSAVASDPDWAEMFEWQRDFVDFYGADNLNRFVAGQGDEFSAANDFQNGRVAMAIDGEWRTSFIGDEAADLAYDTAPFPVPAENGDRYGIGRVGGTIVGLPRGSAHPAEAFALLQYLSTDTAAVVTASNSIGNVPSTHDALESPDLDQPPQFQTFLDIFANPDSHYKETSVVGATDQELLEAFAERWQAGEIDDLQAGLEDVAQQIDDEVSQAG